MSVSPDDVQRFPQERQLSREIVTLLLTALDEISDAVHLFRIDDAATLTRVYQNRAATAAPDVSFDEISEALAEGGAVLRAGRCRDSVCELQARRFTSFAGRFAVAIERDVTERDHLERAYDDAVVRAQLRAERYARLCRLAAQPWAGPDERVTAVLEFALRETQMGSALLMKRTAASVRVWKATGDPALGIPIPESLVHGAHAIGTSQIVVPWPDASSPARFSISCVVLGSDERVLLALGRSHAGSTAEEHDTPRFVGEFLSLCAIVACSGEVDGARAP